MWIWLARNMSVGIVVLSCGAALAAPRYEIVALDVLPGGLDSLAFGLNDVGQVVGASRLNRSGNVGQSRPVIWDYSGQPTELWNNQVIGANLVDINNAGKIIGRYGSGSDIPLPTPGVLPGRAFVWDAINGREDIFLQPFSNSMAAAINDNGQVAGTSEVFDVVIIDGMPTLDNLRIHPFIWDADAGIRDLGTLGGSAAFATDINVHGQVVGRSEIPDGHTRAFIWDEAVGMRELPSIAGGRTSATAINDLGQVLGSESGIGPILWDAIYGTQAIPVGGHSINNLGQVVGGAVGGLAIWDRVNGLQYLADLIPPDTGWQLQIPYAINDAGEIVGYGLFDGQTRGFLMTPVPEPNTLLLAVWALATSFVVSWCNRNVVTCLSAE